MTLQRQLLLTILTLFILMFCGTLAITTIINHNYINKQLQTHARDAATSLGLILSQEAEQNDLGAMTSMIDAVYDRGYYQQITLTDINNKPLVIRQANLKVAEVPDWFVDFVNFKMPTEEALVMAGWKQYGKVSVSSHPGYAYQDLWKNTYFTFFYYCIVSLLLFLFGVLAIHGLLRPLQAITRQAIAIGEGEFPLIQKLPRTVQLRQVATTMNNMVKKLERRFEEYRHVTTELRKRVYHDPVTELHNQTYFFNHIQQEVSNSSINAYAVMVQIELVGLAQYNLVHGTIMGDTLLQQLTKMLKKSVQTIPASELARLIGARFGLLILNVDPDDVVTIMQKLESDCRNFAKNATTAPEPLTLYLGAEVATNGMTPIELMAASEIALNLARTADDLHYNIQTLASDEIHAEVMWSDVLKYILSTKSITISMQPCRNKNQAVLFQQLEFTAIGEDRKSYAGAIVKAMAERFGLDRELDKLIIEKALPFLVKNISLIPKLVLPLSAKGLGSLPYRQWLESTLKRDYFANRIIVEISEFNFVNQEAEVLDFVERLSPSGVQFAFNHYGKSGSDLNYLKLLKIVHLKIDPSYTYHIHEHADNQLFVEVLIRMSHCLDIAVVAEDVDSKLAADTLLQLDVDGLLGDYES